MPNDDLISRKALLHGFDVRKVTEYDESGCGVNYKAVPVKTIESAPAVDAVEVVRCKDCAHYSRGSCGKIKWIMDGYYSGTFERKQPIDFCSQAEKKGQST